MPNVWALPNCATCALMAVVVIGTVKELEEGENRIVIVTAVVEQ